jgi:beta-glucanase (GH16 family)
MIWSPGRVQYYVDDPTHPYASFTPADLPPGSTWPFDKGRFYFLLNLAIGGSWPGPPNASTASPAEMLVDYVRVYQTGPPAPASKP